MFIVIKNSGVVLHVKLTYGNVFINFCMFNCIFIVLCRCVVIYFINNLKRGNLGWYISWKKKRLNLASLIIIN